MKDRFNFRIFKKELNKMVYFSLFDNDDALIFSDSYEESIYYEDEGIMQCIGLRDINNKLIYECDIVRYFCGTDELVYGKRFSIIERDNKQLSFVLDRRRNIYFNDYYDLEVVGNIYQNPELLK